LHAAPASVLAQCDLLDDIEKLISSGKIRMTGISADPDVVTAALGAKPPTLTAMQLPVNLFDVPLVGHIAAAQDRGLVFVANHPFGGADRVAKSRARLKELSASSHVSAELRNKLTSKDEGIFAEIILNLVLAGTGVHVVLPSMMDVNHVRANVRAISNCRFTGEELAWLRRNLAERDDSGPLNTYSEGSLSPT
jgi:aryl-alcohol dehydrogenase-like predicted oxidoreductase